MVRGINMRSDSRYSCDDLLQAQVEVSKRQTFDVMKMCL